MWDKSEDNRNEVKPRSWHSRRGSKAALSATSGETPIFYPAV
jgi:hypothetical protein